MSLSNKKGPEHGKIDFSEDLAYFREKLAKCLNSHNPTACKKLEKQIELLEDSLVVYRISRSSEKIIYDTEGNLIDLDLEQW
jgi:hypothetical protein